MKDESMLNNEKIILRSDNNLITLTNYRIRLRDSSWGKANIVSILLQNISSIEVKYKANIYYFVLSIIFFFSALILQISSNYQIVVYAVILGLVALGLFFYTRKHFVLVSSKGGNNTIAFETKSMSTDKIVEFVDEVEKQILGKVN